MISQNIVDESQKSFCSLSSRKFSVFIVVGKIFPLKHCHWMKLIHNIIFSVSNVLTLFILAHVLNQYYNSIVKSQQISRLWNIFEICILLFLKYTRNKREHDHHRWKFTVNTVRRPLDATVVPHHGHDFPISMQIFLHATQRPKKTFHEEKLIACPV